MTIHIKVPGKLYLAGEYAVTQPYHSAIVFAVDRFLEIEISHANAQVGSFYSENYLDQAVTWKRPYGEFALDTELSQLDLALEVIRTTEAYLQESGQDLSYYNIKISSSLDSSDGKKYGLGSSGAVSVALVKGLLEYYDHPHQDLDVFKLASLAQLKLGKRGSFGDIAASSYTGCILYTCFDKELIASWIGLKPTAQTIKSEWPGLAIERINWGDKLHLAVGWTGQAASTDDLLQQVQQGPKISQADFLAQSEDIVHQLRTALEVNDFEKIGTCIQANRALLQELAKARQIPIETSQLTQLIEIAESHRAFAKTSGAGGGDCGLAIFDCLVCKKETEEAWQEAGIEALDLRIYQKNEESMNDFQAAKP